jgi:hypothetical protein
MFISFFIDIIYFILFFIISFIIIIGLARHDAYQRSLSRKYRLQIRSRRWIRKNLKYINHKKFSYCWAKLLPGLHIDTILALGPVQGKRRLLSLLSSYQTYSEFRATLNVVGHSNHFTYLEHAREGSLFLDESQHFADPQHIIDIATSVNASKLGENVASEIVKQSIKSSITVNTAVTENQKRLIQKDINFPVVFKGTNTSVSDHTVVMAFREIARQVYDKCFNILSTKLETLVIGSAFREFRKYTANHHIFYHFHESEAKDYDRTMSWFLNEIGKSIVAKASKKNRKIFKSGEKSSTTLSFQSPKDIVSTYHEVNKTADRIVFNENIGEKQFEQLLFEDSHYNYDQYDYKNIFEKTGAKIAYGYGMLPLELIFPELPPNPNYSISVNGGKTSLHFKYSNGYCHDTEKWSTLLKHNVMTFDQFSLIVEIVAYVGPLAVFKIMRVNKSSEEIITRKIELPENKKYVKVLDLINSKIGVPFQSRLKYFAVYSNEFLDTLNYCLSIDKKSLTLENTMLFIRRRSGGVSLMSKEFIPAWHLSPYYYQTFALTVYLYAKSQTENATYFERRFTSGWSNLYHFFFSAPLNDLLNFIKHHGLKDMLVIYPSDEIKQQAYLTISNPKHIHSEIILDEPLPKKQFDCPICEQLDGKLRDQVIDCKYKKSTVTFRMVDDDLNKVQNGLVDTDQDPQKLAEIKTRCRENMPFGGFEHEVELHYIRGGPGTGKSHIIRQLATPRDIIYAPFTKLREDYINLTDDNGEKYNLNFKTTHRGMDVRGADRMFVDEFTSMPFEFIKMVAFVAGVKEVYIVGDEGQFSVTGDEGTYIGNTEETGIDLADISRHTLMKNFRNPQDAVNLINRYFDYQMEAVSGFKHSIEVYGPNQDLPNDQSLRHFAFSHASCQANNCINQTVRSWQGSSAKKLVLYVDNQSGNVGNMPEAITVALSRHTEKLLIKHDGSDYALQWLARIGLNAANDVPHPYIIHDDFIFHHQRKEHITTLTEEEKRIDTIVEKFSTTLDPINEDDDEEIVYPLPPLPQETFFERFYLHLENSDNLYKSLPKFLILNIIEHFTVHYIFYKDFLLKIFHKQLLINCCILLIGEYLYNHSIFEKYYLIQITYTIFYNFFFYFNFYILLSALKMFNNFDLYILFSLYLIGYIDDKKFLHSFNPNTYPIIYYLTKNFFLTSKFHYLTRLFSIDNISLFYSVPIITFIGYFFMYFGRYIIFYEYLCDYLSEPFIIFIALLLRYHNFRINWFNEGDWFSLDRKTPDVEGIINNHKIFINFVRQEYNFDQKFLDYLNYFNEFPYHRVIEVLPSITEFYEKTLKPAKDAFLLNCDFYSYLETNDLAFAINEIGSANVEDNFRSGTVNEDFVAPINPRGHPQKQKRTYYQLITGKGLQFFTGNAMQTLQVLGGRYLNKKSKASQSFNDSAQQLVRKIVDEFFSECMDVKKFDEVDVNNVIEEAYTSAKQKKYQNQFKGFDNVEINIVRFHLKDINKPKLGENVDVEKVGQGISAWNKDAQVLFTVGARIINHMFLNSLKDHVIYDNKITPEELKTKVKDLIKLLPNQCTNGISDFTMFDSQQDEFTQALEKEFLRRLGIAEYFIEHYYRFRKGYTIMANGIKGKCNTEKTSGEPMTLLLNTLVSALLTSYLIRGQGPFMLICKGDDGFKRQMNQCIRQDRYAEISKFTNLKIKLSIGPEAEFCGFVIMDDNFIESIPRKHAKLVSHKFRDYEHFTEYQTSLRDWYNQIERSANIYDFISVNSKIYNQSFEQVRAMYDAIKSTAHINKNQFLNKWRLVNYNPIFKTAKRNDLDQWEYIDLTA